MAEEEPPPAGESWPAPKVRILSWRSEAGSLRLELEVLTPGVKTPDVELRVDAEVARDAVVTRARDLIRPNLYLMTVPLPRRDCQVSVVARGRDRESPPASLRFRWTGRDAKTEVRPALHVLAVGIGQYPDPEITPLTYPAKDARDLVVTLTNQLPVVYRSITTQLLIERAASRQQILQGLDGLKQKVEPSDTAVVFLAGHGMNDPAGSYYYLPFDAHTDPASMLSGADLQAALRNISGKVILMIDTCHSGGVGGRRSITRLINDLANENKVVVFAASTGSETSRESPSWRNGAFTKALIEGLRGVADYEEDGKLTLSELETWVGVRVRGLTSGEQTPTLAKPNAMPDYVVSALPQTGRLPTPRQRQRQRLLWGLLGGGAAAAIVIGVLAARPWEFGQIPTVDAILR